MNELTEEQKEKALKRFIYCQEYYKKYQKEHKENCIQNTNKYIEKIKLNPEKLEEYKNKKKEYYQRVGKERYEKRRQINQKKEEIKEQ
jgi:hypothetical protein